MHGSLRKLQHATSQTSAHVLVISFLCLELAFQIPVFIIGVSFSCLDDGLENTWLIVISLLDFKPAQRYMDPCGLLVVELKPL